MTYAMYGDGVPPDGSPPPGAAGHPEHLEEYVVRIAWHPGGAACVTVEHPDHRSPEEVREVMSMLGELGEVADVMAVTPAGRLVTRHG